MISQREARRWKKKTEALTETLRRQRLVWGQEYQGVNIVTLDATEQVAAIVRTARRLGHSVVVVGDNTVALRLMALPHPSEPI